MSAFPRHPGHPAVMSTTKSGHLIQANQESHALVPWLAEENLETCVAALLNALLAACSCSLWLLFSELV